MSEETLVWVCIGGVALLAVVIVVLANYFSNRSNQRRANRMKNEIAEGKYDPKKKYLGDQGSWQTDEYTDTTNAPPR